MFHPCSAAPCRTPNLFGICHHGVAIWYTYYDDYDEMMSLIMMRWWVLCAGVCTHKHTHTYTHTHTPHTHTLTHTHTHTHTHTLKESHFLSTDTSSGFVLNVFLEWPCLREVSWILLQLQRMLWIQKIGPVGSTCMGGKWVCVWLMLVMDGSASQP